MCIREVVLEGGLFCESMLMFLGPEAEQIFFFFMVLKKIKLKENDSLEERGLGE